jgi:uncharacterized Zn finger protein
MRETAPQKATRLLAEGRVRVLWSTDRAVTARVRGDSGIHDVAWTRLPGRWTCTCACYGQSCSHVLAVKAITVRPLERVP